MEKAMFGAGCFWGVQATFDKVKGVKKTLVGFSGGKMKSPSYEDVCTDKTGHVEVIYIEFNPKQIGYDELLDIFWTAHDPTQVGGQGPDMGTQYRSVIFYYSAAQKKAALVAIKTMEEKRVFEGREIVTAIEPAKKFYKAEEYHQKYSEKHGGASCHI